MPDVMKVPVNNPNIIERVKTLISKDDSLTFYITNAVQCELTGDYLDEEGNWIVKEPDYVFAVIQLPVFPVRKKVKTED